MIPAIEAARQRRKRYEFLTRPSPSSKDHGSQSRYVSAHYDHHFFALYCHWDPAEERRRRINAYQHGCSQEHLQVLTQGGSSALARRAQFGQIKASQQPVSVRGQTRGNVCEAALEARDRLDQRFRASALARREYHSNVNSMDNLDECFWNFEAWKRIGSVMTHSPALVSTDHGQSAGMTTNEILAKDDKGVNQAAINSLQRKTFRSRGSKTVDSIEAEFYEQPECPVCLETYLVGQMTLYLPCRHKFHHNCLVPWLEAHTQCPCCRAKVVGDISD